MVQQIAFSFSSFIRLAAVAFPCVFNVMYNFKFEIYICIVVVQNIITSETNCHIPNRQYVEEVHSELRF